jgi:5-methylcytosine-specific restriction endonuclease McrA
MELHIDHIKPKSKYRHLAFDFENLQILCAECNIIKGDREEIDYRENDSRDKLSCPHKKK